MTTAGGPTWEVVHPSYRRDDPALDAATFVDTGSHQATDELVCRAVAAGRIVARLREPCHRPTRVTVVETAAGGALLVVSGDAVPWSAYEADTVESGVQAARAILATGAAYNW